MHGPWHIVGAVTAFFRYAPLRARWALVAASVLAIAVTARALVHAVEQGEPLAYARSGISAGLALAMMAVHHRLRPRGGWGVTIAPLALVVSKPFSGDIAVPWGQVSSVDRQADGLAVRLPDGSRVLVPRFLFEDTPAFEALSDALLTRQSA